MRIATAGVRPDVRGIYGIFIGVTITVAAIATRAAAHCRHGERRRQRLFLIHAHIMAHEWRCRMHEYSHAPQNRLKAKFIDSGSYSVAGPHRIDFFGGIDAARISPRATGDKLTFHNTHGFAVILLLRRYRSWVRGYRIYFL